MSKTQLKKNHYISHGRMINAGLREIISDIMEYSYEHLRKKMDRKEGLRNIVRIEYAARKKLMIKVMIHQLSLSSHEVYGKDNKNDYFTHETPICYLRAEDDQIKIAIEMHRVEGQHGRTYVIEGVDEMAKEAFEKYFKDFSFSSDGSGKFDYLTNGQSHLDHVGVFDSLQFPVKLMLVR